MTKLPIFIAQRLVLRGVTEKDAASYTKHFVDYEIIRHLTDAVPWPYPPDGVLDYIQTQILPKQGKDKWVWGIFLKDNPEELIGVVDLWREGKPEHRGFWLGQKYWGQVFMTEAVEPVMDYAFKTLGFERMVFANAVGNKRSSRIKEKNKARLLYVESKKFVDPVYTQHEVWGLAKDEWLKHKNVSSTYFMIRQACPDDAAAMLDVHCAAVHGTASAFYDKNILDDWSPSPVPSERISDFSTRMGSGDEIAFVAESANKEIVGFGVIAPKQSELRAVYVHPHHGRKKLGGYLLQSLEDVAKEMGISDLNMDASINAEQFYLSHGYQRLQKGEYVLRSGRRMACVKMRKTLRK